MCRWATAVAASLKVRPQFECVTRSKQAHLSCHACHAPEQACMSQLSYQHRNYQNFHRHSTIILPRGWKSPALLDEGNSLCIKRLRCLWESSTQNRCTAPPQYQRDADQAQTPANTSSRSCMSCSRACEPISAANLQTSMNCSLKIIIVHIIVNTGQH